MTDIRQALEEAFKVIHCANDPATYREMWLRFRRLLDAEAWTDAAMCLVPEGWEWAYLDNAAIVRKAGTLKHAYGNASTPAHALLAACLKAKEQADG